MQETSTRCACVRCGRPLPADAVDRTCPACLFGVLIEPALDRGQEDTRADSTIPGEDPSESPLMSFGDYDVLEEIARGGMGVVYRARQRSLGRIVAIKMILAGPFAARQVAQRFRGEAAAAAVLQHPNIVAIHEIGTHEGRHYFSMEHVEGQNLAQLVGNRALAPVRAARYLHIIARAVHHAHEHGILHRDLKPSNILVDAATDQPRITDFGLAKRLDGDASLTVTGQLLGSPNFMPPEQAGAAGGRVSRQSDVYGLGGILFHLLTARAPFQGDSLEQLVTQVLHADPVSPRLLNPAVPRDLETLCLKCLNKEPSQRYATAAEVADELQRFLAGEPILARPVTSIERALRWCRRKPALAAVSVLAAVLLLVVSIGSPIATYRINRVRVAQAQEQYYAHIRLADHYIVQGNNDRALDLLLQCPEAYRNYEWGRLVFLCHQDFLTLSAHTNLPPPERASARPHKGQVENQVKSLQFSPDSRRLFTQGLDGRLRVWSLEDGRLDYELGVATPGVAAFALDRAGRRLAVAEATGAVRLLDADTGQELVGFSGLPEIRALALADDAERLATGDRFGRIQVRAGSRAEPIFSRQMDAVRLQAVGFAHRGEHLWMTGRDRFEVFDIASGRSLRAVDGDAVVRQALGAVAGEEGLRTVVAVSPDAEGTAMMFFTAAGHRVLWRDNAPPLALEPVRGAQLGSLRWAVFSGDRSLVCAGGELGTARVWEVATGHERLAIPHRVFGAAFSSDGRYLATRGSENVARVWDLRSGRESRVLAGHGTLVGNVAFSPDGLTVATASMQGVVKLWSAPTSREVLQGDLWTWGPSISPDGSKIASASWSLDLRIWDAGTGREHLRIRPDIEGIYVTRFSPDNRVLATGGGEGVVRMWDTEDGRELQTLRGHTRTIWDLCFSPDGRELAAVGGDGPIRVWDVERVSRRDLWPGNINRLWQVIYSPDGRCIGTAGQDLIGRVWDTASGQLRFTLGDPKHPVSLLRYTPDGQRIYTSSREKLLRVWAAADGRLLHTLAMRNPASFGVSFSPDGSRMVASMSENTVYGYDSPGAEVLDALTGRDLATLRGHHDPIWQAFFHPNGRTLVTSSPDMTTRQWESFPWRESEYPGTAGEALRLRIARHAEKYWRERRRTEAGLARQPAPKPVSFEHHWDRNRWPARDDQSGPKQIDLTPHYTGLLEHSFAPHAGVSENHLRALAPGTRILKDATFDIRGVVQLRALQVHGDAFRRLWAPQPVRVDGISVHQRARSIAVLHGAFGEIELTGVVPEFTRIGHYEILYADGQRALLPIEYGRHVRSWWSRLGDADSATARLEQAEVAWTGSNPAVAEQGGTLRLYLCRYPNPRPEIEIASINFVSAMTQSAPFLVALTIEP